MKRFPTYQSYFVRKLKLCQYSSTSTSLPMKSSCSNAIHGFAGASRLVHIYFWALFRPVHKAVPVLLPLLSGRLAPVQTMGSAAEEQTVEARWYEGL